MENLGRRYLDKNCKLILNVDLFYDKEKKSMIPTCTFLIVSNEDWYRPFYFLKCNMPHDIEAPI